MAMEEPDFSAPDEEEVAPAAEVAPPAEAPAAAEPVNAGASSALRAAVAASAAGEADVAAAVAHGPAPTVVLPPGAAAAAAAAPQPAETKIPEPEEEHLPLETDSDAWLDLLRDGYLRQLREENEYPEPPPFHRAIHFAADAGGPCPAGKYPKIALNMQLQMLLKARTGGELLIAGKGARPGIIMPPGKGKGNALAAVAPLLAKSGGLPQLLAQMQQGIRSGTPVQIAQQGQLLIQAAKALAAAKAAGNAGAGAADKGKGKGGGWQGKGNGYRPY